MNISTCKIFLPFRKIENDLRTIIAKLYIERERLVNNDELNYLNN